MEPRKKIQKSKKRLLVTDYDLTLLAYNGTDAEMLSLPLIDFVKMKHYDGFYGCTHRAYSNLNFVAGYAKKHLNKSVYTSDDLKKYASTTTATKNFEKRTGLPCLAVSTFEDTLRGKTCGQGFEKIIKPYEEKHIKPKDSANFVRFVLFNLEDKNKQLLQIAKHAASQFPKYKITLNYVDDNRDIIQHAFKVPEKKSWPKNVKLKFFVHDGTGDDAKINRVQEEMSGHTIKLR